jgi:hypothetical protein
MMVVVQPASKTCSTSWAKQRALFGAWHLPVPPSLAVMHPIQRPPSLKLWPPLCWPPPSQSLIFVHWRLRPQTHVAGQAPSCALLVGGGEERSDSRQLNRMGCGNCGRVSVHQDAYQPRLPRPIGPGSLRPWQEAALLAPIWRQGSGHDDSQLGQKYSYSIHRRSGCINH